MALQRAVAGARHKGQRITWVPQGDASKQDLTNATITATIKDTVTGTSRAATGTFVVADAPNGVFTWAYSAADLVAGTYTVQFKADYGGGLYDLSYAEPWTVDVAQ
jgi:hypothetical protein